MRIEKLVPNRLSAAQRELYDQIASGPRAAGPQHFALVDADGALNGPFGLMLHEPSLGQPLQDLGSAIRYRTGLSDRLREIAILAVASATNSEFERFAHERVGRAVGLTEKELMDLATATFSSVDQLEAAAYGFCQRLLDSAGALAEDEFVELNATLGSSTLMELVVLVGYYRTLAQLLHVFDVGVPGSD